MRSVPFSSYSGYMIIEIINTATSVLSGGARKALDVLLPPQCPITGDPVSTSDVLSASGWAQLRFIDDPVCAGCGMPFEFNRGDGAMCGGCLAETPSFDRARAAVLYDDASHKMIVSFKYADRTELAPMFGKWLARAGRSLISEQSILVPVPLHAGRMFARRYNQSALIAGFAATELACLHEPQILTRHRKTRPQQSLSAAARKKNVSGAFGVPEGMKARIRGAHIVVVDDVLTTGATVSACARALKRAGAARVDALVLARVARGGADAI